MWKWTPATFVRRLRRYLILLSAPGVDAFQLKAFRAGRATSMVAHGCPLGEILMAGEWRSAAFARYVDEEAVDAAQLLAQTLDASDGEEDPS